MTQARKPLVAVTGLSGFSGELMKMIEDPEAGLGGNPIPLYQTRLDNMLQWVDVADCLVLAGGVDLHPNLYGESVVHGRGLSQFDLARDEKELEVVDRAVRAGKPLLAICRGHQLFAVYMGLWDEFISDLQGDVVHSPPRHNIKLSKNEPCHSIKVLCDAFAKVAEGVANMPRGARRWFPDDLAKMGWVNSYHHQAIRFQPRAEKKYAEKGLRVLAVSDIGGNNPAHKQLIELMSGSDGRFLSVQWHPEIDYAENAWSQAVVRMFKDEVTRRMQ